MHNPVLYDSPPQRNFLGFEKFSDGSAYMGVEAEYGQPVCEGRGGSEPGSMIVASDKMPRSASSSYIPRGPLDVNPWESWNVEKEDARLAEMRRLDIESAPKLDPAELVFNETWKPTTINQSGQRVRTSSGPRQRTVGRVEGAQTSKTPSPQISPSKSRSRPPKSSLISTKARIYEEASTALASFSDMPNSTSGLLIADKILQTVGDDVESLPPGTAQSMKTQSQQSSDSGSGTYDLSMEALSHLYNDDPLGLYDVPVDLPDRLAPPSHGNGTNKLITFVDDNLIDFD